MSTAHPLELVIEKVGLGRLARELGISPQAIRKWQVNGRMPRTEWTGETNYVVRILELGAGVVSRDQLLGKWPEWPPGRSDGNQPTTGVRTLNVPDTHHVPVAPPAHAGLAPPNPDDWPLVRQRAERGAVTVITPIAGEVSDGK